MTGVLHPGEVHVRVAALDRLPAAATLLAQLSLDERARAGRFRRAQDGERFVRRRWLLRWLLARYGADPGLAPLPTGPDGKPAPPGTSDLHVSASSSGDWAVVAVTTTGEVGVDVERLRPLPDLTALAATALTPAERRALDALPVAGRSAAFLRSWTAKEAALKQRGIGLAVDPRTLAMADLGHVRPLDLGPALVGALATTGPDPSVLILTSAARSHA